MSSKSKIVLSSLDFASKAGFSKLFSSNDGGEQLSQRTTRPMTKSFVGSFSPQSKAGEKQRGLQLNDSKLLTPQGNKASSTKVRSIHGKANPLSNSFAKKKKGGGYIVRVPQLTKQKIEKEINYMRAFMENNVIIPKSAHIKKHASVIEDTIRKTLIRLPLLSNAVDVQAKSLQNEPKPIVDPEWERYLMNLSNPSIGFEGLKKRFPVCFKAGFNKYHNSFRSNYKSKILESTMVSFRVKNESSSVDKYDSKEKSKLTSAIKLKLKWKTIKWLKDTQKPFIAKLLRPYFQEQLIGLAMKKVNDFNEGVTFEEFAKVLRTNGITTNREIMRKLYWIFDEDGNNSLEPKEILSGLEIFRESSPEEKVKAFFELCDTDGSKTVSKDEFLALLKKTIVNADDMHSLRRVVDKIFKCVDSKDTGELSLEQFQIDFKTNKELAEIISNNTQELKAFDDTINRDIERDIMKFNPSQNAALRQRLFGMNYDYYPISDKKFISLINALVDTKEQLNVHKDNMVNRKSSSDNESESDAGQSDEERQAEMEKAKQKIISEKNRRQSLRHIFSPKLA